MYRLCALVSSDAKPSSDAPLPRDESTMLVSTSYTTSSNFTSWFHEFLMSSVSSDVISNLLEETTFL